MKVFTLKIFSYETLHDEAEHVALESHNESTVLFVVVVVELFCLRRPSSILGSIANVHGVGAPLRGK